ncbi:2-hydroxyacid dehydrogenase [Acidisoma cellulosilytica]|uniref:2-hydroxyacid dehydrogenase n=1 Tax=Acidisoma cellulosilyticum TaxID=2802395 RepID=A0A963Z418_9PROT|nr:2-hydroxyacid dehydrogenase [Acidisoma cellulosilyticum]MCB8882071.1 2-hydroxyacid dehydrogenase [Acidisoma cellulosilyticum]
MSRPDLLQAGPLMPYLVEELERRFTLWPLHEQAEPAAFIAREGRRFQAAVTSTFVGFPADLVEACPNLRLIASFGVGTDSLALPYAQSRGITVTNTPDVLNDDTANMAIALLLACSRNLVANDRYLRAGQWPRAGDPPLGRGIAGRIIGIVGLGRIGMVIAQRLEAFGCVIAYHTRNLRADVPWRHAPDLVALAREAAALIVIVPGGPATQHMIDAEVMDALGPEGLLINVARGSVVDEAALVTALTEGRLGGAGLDVYQNEPHVPEAMFGLDQVILQPHQGSATRETRRAMADLVIGNLDRFFAGEALLTPLALSPSSRSVSA